ncbi:sensor histidine kinase [Aquipuribacter nitratireducens]|uniref:histidine kinase n=1 Tax=Aquipuribacter nitratireducens TaxID=650104 RepID=A0ABW0GPC1_9MICO
MRDGDHLVLSADGRRDGRRSRRDRVVDWVVFVTVGLMSAVGLVIAGRPLDGSGFRPVSGLEVWVDLVLGVGLLVALFWRRRFPVTLGVVSAFAAAFSTFAGGPAFVMLLTVAIHRRWPWALLVGGANLVAAVVLLWWRGEGVGWVEWVIIMAFGTVFTAAVIGFGMFLRARRLLVASLRERAERAEREQQRSAEAARQGERTRIAREMHDVLAHRISLVSMHAGALEFSRDASPEEVATAAGVIRDNAHRALVDLREVIGVLRTTDDPDTGDDGTSTSRPQPTLDDLPGLLAETRAAGVGLRERVELADAPLPLTTARTAYRVLQEGLTNARKHGRGGAVDVCVSGAPGSGLSLEVRNALRPGTGAGLDDAARVPGSGVGLVGLAERTRLAGGRWEHGVVDDVFRLRVWLPWPVEAA